MVGAREHRGQDAVRPGALDEIMHQLFVAFKAAPMALASDEYERGKISEVIVQNSIDFSVKK